MKSFAKYSAFLRVMSNLSSIRLSAKYANYLYNIRKFIRGLLLILGLLLTMLLVLVLILLSSFAICNIIFSIKSHEIIEWNAVSMLSHFDEVGYVNLLTSIIALTALSGPAIAYYWNMRQNHRHELNLSYDFLKEWRGERVNTAIYNVRDYFHGVHKNDMPVASQALFDYTKKIENRGLLIDVRTLLNFFESIAAACNKSHLNESLIRRYFEYAFERYYEMFLPYIYDTRRAQGLEDVYNNKGVYYDFTQLAERWKL